MELIDKAELLKNFTLDDKRVLLHIAGIRAAIECIPAIDAEPVRHGHWVKRKEDALIHWDCSECGIAFLDNAGLDRYFYCPHCGAKMDKEQQYGDKDTAGNIDN